MHGESQPGVQETFLEGMLIPVSTEGKATFSHMLIWKLSQRENTSLSTQKHDFLPQPGDALLDKIITGDHGKEAHVEASLVSWKIFYHLEILFCHDFWNVSSDI